MGRTVVSLAGVLLGAALTMSTLGVVTPAPPPPDGLAPGFEVVQLTETLVVNSGDVIRDKHFIWHGPADEPMLSLAGAQFATLDQLSFEVPDGNHATAAIELTNTPAGGPLGTHLSNIKIGKFGVPGNIDYGLLWTDDVNGDSNTVTNVSIFGASRAGVSIDNPQATTNSFRGLYVFNAPIAFRSVAGGTVQCDNCGFIGSTDVDVELVGGAGLILTGMYSEHSRAFARVGAGAGGGGLTVLGGYWQWGEAADGPTITGLDTCCFRSYVRLTDFIVTPIGGPPRGSIAGFPPEMIFLSNVAGIPAPSGE